MTKAGKETDDTTKMLHVYLTCIQYYVILLISGAQILYLVGDKGV